MSCAFPAVKIAFAVAGIRPFTGIPDFLCGGGNALFQRSNSGQGLERGAGRIESHGGPVQQRRGGILAQLRIVLAEGRQVIGGVGSHG